VTEREIRGMLPTDIPPVMAIEHASFISPWTDGMFRAQLAFGDRTITLVLLEDGRIAGYAAAAVAFDEIHLLSIAVAPDRRRRGSAGALLAALIERGRARGAVRVILEVRDGNRGARSFYRMHGFTEIGRRRRYYTDTGEDAIIMEYDIPS
jgi:ribosomal-protein-alanine N-acetyltransferase